MHHIPPPTNTRLSHTLLSVTHLLAYPTCCFDCGWHLKGKIRFELETRQRDRLQKHRRRRREGTRVGSPGREEGSGEGRRRKEEGGGGRRREEEGGGERRRQGGLTASSTVKMEVKAISRFSKSVTS